MSYSNPWHNFVYYSNRYDTSVTTLQFWPDQEVVTDAAQEGISNRLREYEN